MNTQRLVALGGRDGINRLRSAEIYDPGSKPKMFPLFRLFNLFLTGTNQWDPLPDMNEIRSNFSAVTYGNRVFAIGGFNGTDVLAEVEQFNFEEQTWTRYTSLVTPRSGTRCILALVIITQGTCVQVHRVRGQGVCAGRVRRHLQAALSGVLHPRTSWHQA